MICFGLFGSVSQDLDIDKQDSSREKKNPRYLDLYQLVAKYVTPNTIAVLLIPLKQVRYTKHDSCPTHPTQTGTLHQTR